MFETNLVYIYLPCKGYVGQNEDTDEEDDSHREDNNGSNVG